MHKNGFSCLCKVFFVLSLLVAIPVVGIAGPFGLEMGMSKTHVSKVYGLDENNYIKKVPNKSPFFEVYMPFFSNKSGLCRVVSSTEIIETNVFGTEVINKFDSIESALNAKYGSNLKVDKLNDGSIWNESKDWMNGLLKKERTLSTFWDKKEGSNLSDNIDSIVLRAHGIGQNAAFISLTYSFSNIEECREEKRQKNEQGL